VVLDRWRDAELPVGHETLQGELLADQALFEDDAVVVGTAKVLLRFFGSHLIADDPYAFAAGEAGGLDCQVAVVLVDVVTGRRHVFEGLELRTARDVVFFHEPTLERLVSLDPGLRFPRTEGIHSGIVQRIGDAGREWCFRADDRQRRADFVRVGRNCGRVRRVQ